MDCRALVLLLSLPIAAASAASDDDADGSPKSGPPAKRWSVSLHETAFHAYEGARVADVLPSGADGYRESMTLLTPGVGVGYAFTERWSVEAFMQMGPRSSFAPTADGWDSYPRTEFESSFTSVLASREFNLREGWSLAPKFGLAHSVFDYKEDADATRSRAWTESDVGPVVSLELKIPFTDRVSASADYTRYFTDEDELNGAYRVGLRFRF